MTDLKTFFDQWMQIHRNDIGADISPALAAEQLAMQFEQDANSAGYDRDEREDEIGIVALAIRESLEGPGFYKDRIEIVEDKTPPVAPIMEQLEKR
jgi:hypothetical protein